MPVYHYGPYGFEVDDSEPSTCPRCCSTHTKNKGSWDKCMDCGKRYVPDSVKAYVVEEVVVDEKFARLVMKDRADGMTWDEVRDKHGINKGQSAKVRQIMKDLNPVADISVSDEQPGELPEIPTLGSTSNTQAMKHALELEQVRVALHSAGLPQRHSGRYVPEEIFKQLYAQIVEQVPSVLWIGDKAPTHCPACHCPGPGWDVIESPSGQTYDLLLCNSCGVVLSHEAVPS
jgi:hypothetical protein